MIVAADVVDTRTDIPRVGEAFLVDTNVWFWYSYSRSNMVAAPYQVQEYPIYLNRARRNKSRLLWTPGVIAELLHIIEREEKNIYNHAKGTGHSLKAFRDCDPKVRASTASEMAAVMAQVFAIAECLPLSTNSAEITSSVARLGTELLDGYDCVNVAALRRDGVLNVLTDDGDFASVSGITVFTANSKVIQAARAANRLVARPTPKQSS